ncbi:MAG TPA: class I SAM-dependent methyltransferase [Xanthobacteraceae bacterium]|jgi:SAM-dependent methyltransferase|nr:class I SAM-dependent methyltransferase [Xanthobacteraceae bacterium]
MSAPYAARYAELYDLFYRDKPYAKEARFIGWVLRKYGIDHGSRILELACGTGEHAVRLSSSGYSVTASDNSRAMIEIAREKAIRHKAQVTFERRDMRKSSGPHCVFDAALCLFDSIGYAQTDAEIGAVFEGVYKRLRPGGLFVVEFWHSPAMLREFEPIRVRRFRDGTSRVLRISETALDKRRSLAHVDYNVYRLRVDSTYDHFAERHTNRYFTVLEMGRFARLHGFAPVRDYDGFRPRIVSDRTWHVLSVWKKADTASQR